MVPTMHEVLFDYNPYFHASKYCFNCSKGVMQKGFGVVQRFCPILPDWDIFMHWAEDTVSNVVHVLAPRLLGLKAERVLQTECECDMDKTKIRERNRFQCEFHITQEDLCNRFELQEESEDDMDFDHPSSSECNLETLMSVHLDTFLEKRYEWYGRTMNQLPRVIRWVVLVLMDILSIHYNCLLFWARNGGEIWEKMIANARAVSQGAISS